MDDYLQRFCPLVGFGAEFSAGELGSGRCWDGTCSRVAAPSLKFRCRQVSLRFPGSKVLPIYTYMPYSFVNARLLACLLPSFSPLLQSPTKRVKCTRINQGYGIIRSETLVIILNYVRMKEGPQLSSGCRTSSINLLSSFFFFIIRTDCLKTMSYS